MPGTVGPSRPSSRLAAWALVIAAGAALPACSGNDDTVVIARPGPNGTGITTTIPRELSPREGQKLLREISANPKRLDKLTPAEKRFLSRAVVARSQREDEEDNRR